MGRLRHVLDALRESADPAAKEQQARLGFSRGERLGVKLPDLRRLARRWGTDHELALGLWQTGIVEARILASMVAEPDRLTEEEMEAWVQELDAWDLCDQVCINLFEKSPLAWDKAVAWMERTEEYVRRAGLVLLARFARKNRDTPDERFLEMLSLLEEAALDERKYVHKAASWALRSVGKRSRGLKEEIRRLAERLVAGSSKPGRWVGRSVLRELDTLRR